jgi:hypothetical protein
MRSFADHSNTQVAMLCAPTDQRPNARTAVPPISYPQREPLTRIARPSRVASTDRATMSGVEGVAVDHAQSIGEEAYISTA